MQTCRGLGQAVRNAQVQVSVGPFIDEVLHASQAWRACIVDLRLLGYVIVFQKVKARCLDNLRSMHPMLLGVLFFCWMGHQWEGVSSPVAAIPHVLRIAGCVLRSGTSGGHL